MLPSYGGAAAYPAGPRRRKAPPRQGGAPWALLLTLALSSACLYATRRRSLAAAAGAGAPAAAARRALGAAPDALGGLYSDAGADPAVAAVTDPEGAAAVAGADAEAAATFSPGLHALYKALPPQPPATEAELAGGWAFSEAVYDRAARLPAAEVLSWAEPRLVLLRSFLSPAEVAHLVAAAQPALERSQVLAANETEEVNDVRTSFGAWPKLDPVLDAIYNRIHAAAGVPREFGEDMYVLNYKLGQRYDAHNDNCMDEGKGGTADATCRQFLERAGGPACSRGAPGAAPQAGGGPTCGDRVATVITFLKSPAAGGYSAFPSAALTAERMAAAGRADENDGSESWYCRAGLRNEVLSVAPTAGDAILFWDYAPGGGAGTGSYADGSADPAARPVRGALHAGCPVEEGQKWIATRWIRSARFA
jgi:prolyl 4-hydroxylase